MANPGARQAGSHESSAGVQGRQPQNVPPWHFDYLELKLLKTWPIKRGAVAILSCSPETGNKSLMWKVLSFPLEVEDIFLTKDQESSQEACKKQACYSFNLLPQVQTLFRSLTEYPKPKFLCHVNYAQIYCLSEKYESCTLPALVTPYVLFLFFFLSSMTRDWTQTQ